MREFYDFYVATLRDYLDNQFSPPKEEPHTHVLVRGCRVHISLPTIRHFLCGANTDVTRDPLTPS